MADRPQLGAEPSVSGPIWIVKAKLFHQHLKHLRDLHRPDIILEHLVIEYEKQFPEVLR